VQGVCRCRRGVSSSAPTGASRPNTQQREVWAGLIDTHSAPSHRVTTCGNSYKRSAQTANFTPTRIRSTQRSRNGRFLRGQESSRSRKTKGLGSRIEPSHKMDVAGKGIIRLSFRTYKLGRIVAPSRIRTVDGIDKKCSQKGVVARERCSCDMRDVSDS
jgi:hypothetical protein